MAVDDVHDVAERSGGLSRRQMIKASAIAGAAAWTAPVIIDSLSSPAAAYSGTCNQYTVKLQPNGSTYRACFGGSATACFTASGTRWGAAESAPGGCSQACGDTGATLNGSHNYLPTVSTVTLGSGANTTLYYRVVFPASFSIGGGQTTVCGFQSGSTDWMIGGRYGPGDPGSQFILIDSSMSVGTGGPTAPANGGYNAATNTGWVRANFSGGSSIHTGMNNDALNYIYLKYCCSRSS